MDATGHLRAGDGEAILRLLDDARRDDPGPGLPWALLDGLRGLGPPGTCVSYQVLDIARGRYVMAQDTMPADDSHDLWEADPAAPSDDDERAYFELLWGDPLCSYHQRTGDARSVLLSTDFFPTDRDWSSRAIRQAVDPELRSLLHIPLPSSGGIVRRLLLGTYGRWRLGERERQLGALLRPHLEELRLDSDRRRAGVPPLTPREWEILALTAAGLTHAEIAARLVVSVSTVHKHMENVRVRLGVRTAAAAAAIALPHAPAAGPGMRGRATTSASRLGRELAGARR